MSSHSVPLHKLVEEFKLDVVHKASDYDKVRVTVEDVNRPALQLVGFYEHFEPARLQMIGMVEFTYLNGLGAEQRYSAFDRFFSYKCPALVISRGLQPFTECLETAQKHDVTILSSTEATASLLSAMIARLKDYLSPRITRHGVLVEVYGEGLLLLGDSGVGKSEAAIELLKRGHRLIADDAVEIHKTGERSLEGTAPELIRHYIELRGIGVINVAKLYGMGSVKDSTAIDMVINLEQWNENTTYDRLGIEDQYTEILGIEIPSLVIPVKPGRNLAVIIEVAAMNNRQKRLGYNAALEFTEQISRHFEESMNM